MILGNYGNFTNFFINDLNNEQFDYNLWSSYSGSMTNNDIKYCEGIKILGKYNAQTLGYLERVINVTNNLANFEYFKLDFSFSLYFFKKIANYAIKVFLDDNYIYGQSIAADLSTLSINQVILCDYETTFYQNTINVTYYKNNYFKNGLNNESPKIRIQVFPSSECNSDSDCGWGINNFVTNVTRYMPKSGMTCNYIPYTTTPCAFKNSSLVCLPGYFANKILSDTYCVPCPANCLDCQMQIKCTNCLPGYAAVGQGCGLADKTLSSVQSKWLKIDTNRYFNNMVYETDGHSFNFWYKSAEDLSTVEKPLVLIDPYLLTYNTTTVNYALRHTSFNYLFSYSALFNRVLNYPVNFNNSALYQTTWIPVSITFGYSSTSNSTYVQMSINNEPSRASTYNGYSKPSQILLFGYFSQVYYRFIKLWDRYIPTDMLNQANYMYIGI